MDDDIQKIRREHEICGTDRLEGALSVAAIQAETLLLVDINAVGAQVYGLLAFVLDSQRAQRHGQQGGEKQ